MAASWNTARPGLMASDSLTGRAFGLWTVLAEAPRGTHNLRRWQCRCECGIEKAVYQCHLVGGRSASCGCERRAKVVRKTLKHGAARKGQKTAEYTCWRGMLARCYNSKERAFPDYGGRGISVCDRWRESFDNFLADMGSRPEGKSIDRIDVNGPYAPENCRWADSQTQARNKRNSRRLSFGGRDLTIPEWAEVTGIPAPTLYGRLAKGWSASRVLSV